MIKSEALGSAGDFSVCADSIIGPAEYMAQYSQKAIFASARVLAHAAGPEVTVYQLIAVALQTDYAAWLGRQQASDRPYRGVFRHLEVDNVVLLP
jgi:hypothetical protein